MEERYFLRWFFPQRTPESVSLWFARVVKDWFEEASKLGDVQEPLPPMPVQEIHLLARGRIDLWLRLAEGRLELGHRVREGEEVKSERDTWTGFLESWGHWRWRSSDLPAASIAAAFQATLRDRLPLARTRREVKYEILPSGRLTAIPLGPTESSTVTMSLDSLVLMEKADWWSLELDFSTPKVTPIMVEQLVRLYGGPKLRKESSIGTPKWLSLVYPTVNAGAQTTTMRRRDG